MNTLIFIFLLFFGTIGLYFTFEIAIAGFQFYRLIKYFKQHPNGLPLERPPYIQKTIDEVGEAKIQELYRDYRNSL